MSDDRELTGSRREALRWMRKAHDDLIVAAMIRDSNAGVNWAACFHAQQAAEKALKAILVAVGIDFPRSHALERLLGLLPSESSGRFDASAVQALSPWAVAGRYPEDIPNPDTTTTRTQVQAATTIVETAEKLIESLARHGDD